MLQDVEESERLMDRFCDSDLLERLDQIMGNAANTQAEVSILLRFRYSSGYYSIQVLRYSRIQASVFCSGCQTLVFCSGIQALVFCSGHPSVQVSVFFSIP